MKGYTAIPPSGNGPGLLLLPAWWGLNPFFIGLSNRLASEGYVVFTPDYYKGQIAATIDEARELKSKLKQKLIFEELSNWINEFLKEDVVSSSKIGVIGFSLGARMALELSAVKPEAVCAVSVFYGTSLVDYSTSQAAYQGHFAATDEWTSLSGIKKLEKALRTNNRSVDFFVYPETGHWFFESDQLEAFNPYAALLAWERLLGFLKSHLSA